MEPITYRVAPGTPRCLLQDGLRMLDRLKDVARHHGFMLSLYGSITDGPGFSGRDVDMLAVPWRPVDVGHTSVIVQNAMGLGFVLLDGPSFGSMGTASYLLQETVSGQILDLQFREIRIPIHMQVMPFEGVNRNDRHDLPAARTLGAAADQADRSEGGPAG